MFLIANFDPKVYEILVIFRIGGMYIQRSTYDELISFFVRKVFSIFWYDADLEYTMMLSKFQLFDLNWYLFLQVTLIIFWGVYIYVSCLHFEEALSM